MLTHGPKGLLVAAPSSGSGKTLLTLALLRALKDAGYDVSAAKAGPDYIDPAFHALACGQPAFNLDPWAMDTDQLRALAGHTPSACLLIEGMMGLFDGAADGTGSAADLAGALRIPVLLVVDAAKQSHSIAALVRGFRDHRADLKLAGVLLNKVGSLRHEHLLRSALTEIDVPVFGAIPRNEALVLPERHLGLVQAAETPNIEMFIERAAKLIGENVDLEALAALFVGIDCSSKVAKLPGFPVLGNHITIARDRAFSFLYPHVLSAWENAGVKLSFFSPLADEAPEENCDAIYLPGGYPELHGETLSAAKSFKNGMMRARAEGKHIFGECGGYMVLGQGIADKDGKRHEMLGLLDLVTSFEKRKLHLGYRKATGLAGIFEGMELKGHEFHYSTVVKEDGQSLFRLQDARGETLGTTGLIHGNVMGSYMHLITALTDKRSVREPQS